MVEFKKREEFLGKYISMSIIVCIGTLTYYPILNNQLLDFWDDQWVVINHYTEGGINIHNLYQILTEFYHGQYSPINEYLYLLIFSGFGYNPFFFHLASLFIHVINSIIVYLLIRKFLLISNFENKETNYISFFTSLIFCIHPINVESVAWMSASKVLVYSFFYLLSTYFFLLFLERNNWKYYILTYILYIISFLGKEQAVVFPMFMCVLSVFFKRGIKINKIFLITLPFFISSIFFGILTILSQSAFMQGGWINSSTYTIDQRFVFACYSYLEYLYKIIFPINLSYLYPFPIAIGSELPSLLLLYPLILVIILLTLWKYIQRWLYASPKLRQI